MTDHLAPSPDARARIQHLGQSQLQTFFDEIPAAAMRPLAAYFPKVDGFRPGSPAGIVRQKEALARRLSRPTANDYDYHALYMAWRTWIDETQPNAPLIQNLVDELEEAADLAVGTEARRLAIEAHTDLLLKSLKNESQENRCTREKIERLYTLSPLPETADARSIIAVAKSAADVERDATFHDLPKRLDQDEHEIQSLKSELKIATDRLRAISDEVTRILRAQTELRDEIRELKISSNTAQASASEQADKRAQNNQNDNQQESAEADTKSPTDDLDKLRRAIAEFGAQFDSLGDVHLVVQKLGLAFDESSREQKRDSDRIEAITRALDQVMRDVDALLEDRTRPDRIAPLVEQVAKLESRVDTITERRQSLNQSEALAGSAHIAELKPRCAPLGVEASATPLSSHLDLTAGFVNCLLSLGLRKSGAQILSEECVAAVAARQAVFFQGAFASRVAELFARTVGGVASARLVVPIGIQDADELRQSVDAIFEPLGGDIGGLAVNAVNHAPLELTRGMIAECIDPFVSRGMATPRRIAVFAALSRGVASLSIEPETFELGPVFDLDYFDWRTSPPESTTTIQSTFLPGEVDRALHSQAAKAKANVEEALHLARAFVRKRNPAIERAVVRAYQALHIVRSDQQTLTPLQSLFFGWLLPYWRTLGLSKEQVDTEFDGGKVHGAALDARLTAMFKAEFPDDKNGSPQ